ncbi:MAG: hypothetical protein ABIZ91_12295 [Gemmatimonadaceae bacterium]
MLRSRFSHSPAFTLIGALSLAACMQLPVEGEFPSPDAPARLVRESVGGIASLRVRTEIDSASRVWTLVTCAMNIPVAECGAKGHRSTGSLSVATIAQLFADTQKPEFRALAAKYPSGVVVADGMGHTVVVTANGFTRTIEWEDGATVPAPLEQFSSDMITATRSGNPQ